MPSSLETILGGRTAAQLMLYLIHYGEVYASGAARDLSISLGPVQRQLERFEDAGLFISKRVGRTRVYTFNPKVPAARKLEELARLYYDAMPLRERESLFSTQRRPRRKGKPVRG